MIVDSDLLVWTVVHAYHCDYVVFERETIVFRESSDGVLSTSQA
jgi:hypothetical protein